MQPRVFYPSLNYLWFFQCPTEKLYHRPDIQALWYKEGVLISGIDEVGCLTKAYEDYNDAERFGNYALSIREIGIRLPISAIDEGKGGYRVDIGNHRLVVARYLKLATLPCIVNADNKPTDDAENVFTEDRVRELFHGNLSRVTVRDNYLNLIRAERILHAPIVTK